MSLKTCLIVDDEVDICEILEFYLENTRMFKSIITANNGTDAMTKLQNQVFDLIILDCNMPRAKGSEVAKHLGKNNKNSVIVISGDLDRDVLKEFVAIGVKNFLVKPFDRDVFYQKVGEIISHDLSPTL